MLYYSSLHPDWDYQGSFPSTARARQISELLEAIALNHSRNTYHCIDQLERLGIVLGSGSFEAALLQRDPLGDLAEDGEAWIQEILTQVKAHLTAAIWYCFQCAGRLYVLVCYPRLYEDSPAIPQERRRLYDCFSVIAETLEAPRLRILLSDIQSGDAAIFRCFNNLHHAMEYYDFRQSAQRLLQLDAERQLHGAFIEDMNAYRQFSVSIADQLIQDSCHSEDLARQVIDAILQNGAPSIESVHHHVQMFILSFTDYLGSSGLVDATYIRRHHIVYRVMGFETEQELYRQIQQILEELRRQHQVLLRIGRQKRIQNVKEYVEQRITDPTLSVGAVSEQFRIGSAQLAKQFRYYYGLSLSKFIQQTRFKTAQSLIDRHPDWTMAQVARQAGYSDPSTMYRAFHQFGQTTPGTVRLSAKHNALEPPDSREPI